MMQKKFFPLWLLLLSLVFPALGQDVTIELGEDQIPINQYYTITVSIRNEVFQERSKFPEIEGFKKSSTSSATETHIIGNQVTTIHRKTQNYAPLKEGTFVLKPFSMVVNGRTVNSAGATIKVGPPAQLPQAHPLPGLDPFEQLLEEEDQPQEYVEREDNAFLALTTSKDEVYVGEGVAVTFALYMAASDQGLLDFYDFGSQIPAVLKQLKPANVWEEASEEREILPEPLTIDGKAFLRFKIYESVYYPLNNEPLLFPSVGLKMIKYKVARNPTLFGQNRVQDFKTYYTKPKIVKVKDLPPHPLKDAVAVGNYRLRESVSTKNVEVNQAFNYMFQIVGEGNLAAINAPVQPETRVFEFYSPEVYQQVNRHNGRVSGMKAFKYYTIPKAPGQYNFDQFFSWIFFNPQAGRYDTLRASTVVQVTGERDYNASIQSLDLGPFYNLIDQESNTLTPLHQFEEIKLYTNIIVLLLIGSALFLFFKKAKP